MNLSHFEALSFDCYGTLIDWESGILGVLVPWARQHRLGVDDETLLATYARQESDTEAEMPNARYPDVLARSFIGVGRELNAPVRAADAQRLASSVPDWPAFPDSRDALSSLAERYQLFILSNVDRESFRASEEQLGVRFTDVVTAEDVGSYKPSKRNFEALMTHAGMSGVQPGRLLHVAQSLFHDHVPAKEVGLPTVWIDRRGGRDGWGATPAPKSEVVPDWMFPSMAAFAAYAAHETRVTGG
jgi:2-haloacid dehalogenase